MVSDDLFHAVTWTITLIGSLVAVQAWRNGEVARRGASTSARCSWGGASSTSSTARTTSSSA
jgi:uncharacterized membrane protein